MTQSGGLGFLAGGGEMGERMRRHDWASTVIGPAEHWPQSLKTSVSICLNSRFPMILWWGAGLTILYNDPYIPILGHKHPDRALGRPGEECWREAWPVIGPLLESVMNSGEANWADDFQLFIDRSGYLEECYFQFSYSPIRDESGAIAGVFTPVSDATQKVIAERRLSTLRALAAAGYRAANPAEACEALARVLAGDPFDVPFAAMYLLQDGTDQALLTAVANVEPETSVSPRRVTVGRDSTWLGAAFARGERCRFDALDCDVPATAPWDSKPSSILVLPLRLPGETAVLGWLVVGASARKRLDADYDGFFDLVAQQLSAALATAVAYETEKKRAESLLQIDRAKTAFFSNVSHEFRTPLTLMLGPLEDAVRAANTPRELRASLELAHRNTLRILKLVNTLLDFSRIEAGRSQPQFAPADLGALTADLASTFRSTMEHGGLSFIVDAPALAEPVFVDRDMWEKIVLNLLSNAFKHTFEGEVRISLRSTDGRAVLEVADTGVGIAPEHLPRIFERFYRVPQARGRSYEGSGIGLSLVHELVRLHGGELTVRSDVGGGSVFTVAIPLGTRPAADAADSRAGDEPESTRARDFVEEASRWLPAPGAAPTACMADGEEQIEEPAAAGSPQRSSATILVADDNADMRTYLRGLLQSRFNVVTAADGQEALAHVASHQPELVLADVMMPHLDGFGLLAALRAAEPTRMLPVILLSARAGEEARIEGLAAGADDYLTKPFFAREVLARVESQISLSRIRRESRAALEAALAESERHAREVAEAGALLTTLLDFVPVGITIALGAPSFPIVANSEECRKIFGVPLQQLQGWPAGEHTDAFGLRRAAGAAAPAAAETPLYRATHLGETVRDEEWVVCRADGDTRIVLIDSNPIVAADGEILGAINSWRDVTERKRTEERLRLAHARVQATMAAAEVGAWIWDLKAGRITADANLARLYGFPDALGSDASPQDHFAHIHPDDRARVREAIDRAFATGRLEVQEYRVGASLPSMRWVTGRGFVLFDASGAPETMSGLVIDIGDRKAMEEALRAADRQKDEFLAMLAHELRNPLAPICNAGEVLARILPAGSPAQPVVDMVKRQVTQLTRLVDDLLDVSRITRGRIELKREPVPVAHVVSRALESIEPLVREKRHQVTVNAPYEPLYVSGDPVRLVQCVANVLTNAAKYTDRGGAIRIDVRTEGEVVVIAVTDTGLGIAPDMLPRIFDLFVQSERTLDRSGGGLGIGLSVVKNLVEMHGGSVEAQSGGVGRGSTFALRLPAIQSPQPAGAGEAALPVNARRVLIVDDNRDAAESLAMILQLQGHTTLTLVSAEEALATAAAFQPDVVLLDIGLPGMDGYEVARRLRSQPPCARAKLVAVTGYGSDEDRLQAQQAGFDDHLVKPVSIADLGRSIGG